MSANSTYFNSYRLDHSIAMLNDETPQNNGMSEHIKEVDLSSGDNSILERPNPKQIIKMLK
jgi:hypothetical protein